MFKISFIPHFSFLIFLLSANNAAWSQENTTTNPDVYGVRTHYGFIIPHSSELENISEANPWGIQLEWSRLRLGQNSWENCNCYAQTGFSFNYFNYGNPDQLGSSYNLIYFAEPYLGYKRPLFASFRAGIGVTYLNRVYDEVSNPENTFFSTPVSFILLLNLSTNYRINENFIISATAHYNHISNGGMSKPNKGMNFPTFGVGVSYIPDPQPLVEREKVGSKRGKVNGYARLFGTLPTVGATDEFDNERKLLLGLAGGALYQITNINAVNIGMELIRDGSWKERAIRRGESYDHHLAAVMLGNNFTFGRITFNQQLGYYAYKPFPLTKKDFYQRYELLYTIGDHFQIGGSLKAHGHVAENIDVRFGVIF